MTLHLLSGGDALSDFRVARLCEALRPHLPQLDTLSQESFYLVDGEASALPRLRELVQARGDLQPRPDEDALYVVPRLGTLSPWSSKATDIARVCGLDVRRLERGRILRFAGAARASSAVRALLHDPMTESVLADPADLARVFDVPAQRPLKRVDVQSGGRESLVRANIDWGLALSDEEIDYLLTHFLEAGRNPSDAELMMFAQINSEHCRHKIFNAEFTIDGETQPHSPFQMIRMTHAAAPEGVLSAYKDNAAVVVGHEAMRFMRNGADIWHGVHEPVHLLMKVETHNHPTGISPDPGAATGAGGEIRDEAATGRGGRPKAGLCGFSVSHLRIPEAPQPWEYEDSRPSRMATPLDIMLEAPIGAAAYNNEFGRPNLAGYFRSFEQITPDGRRRGYHKPIMIAGGYGNIREGHVEKLAVPVGAQLVVLGGPAMLIGLGGGAASSQATGSGTEALDFASVQRANPELERRCQEVIDACWALGDDNPILSIHDVGAGGISNALPELIDADGRGGRFRLADVHCADPSLSPMEIWSNESQERYVLAVSEAGVARLQAFCDRERCPMAVVGEATVEPLLRVDAADGEAAVNMPMPVLLGKTPRMRRSSQRAVPQTVPFDTSGLDFRDAALRVLRHPTVAAKDFLINIGDRTVGGLTVRDQFVGPWQVAVADCAITATGFESETGEAMAMGERTPAAILDSAAAARMAVAESLTNLAAAAPASIRDVRLSANWMAACGKGDEDARLFDAVRAVGAELCPALGVAIPVGKDSLSMSTVWKDGEQSFNQTAPVSLIVTAFAPVPKVRAHVTPQLLPADADGADTRLLLVDLGAGRNRLGASILAQVHDQLGETPPDIDDADALRVAFEGVCTLVREGRVLACHDRSDGGLFATLAEMAFAGHCGLEVDLKSLGDDAFAAAFAEEAGWVLQVRTADEAAVRAALPGIAVHAIGAPRADQRVVLRQGETALLDASRVELQRAWAETSYRIARLRDAPDCVDEEFERIAERDALRADFDFEIGPGAPAVHTARPRVAILREQGVNGHVEMAWAFDAAGFEAVDVHMSDLLEGRRTLEDVRGVVACGGFSYGDVLGAGQGWARSILFNTRARDMFASFLADPDRFALGVCNGCQMMAALAELIPGTEGWPALKRNRSEQFEARWSQVEIPRSRSILFDGMAGAVLPVAVAHGEGRMVFAEDAALPRLAANAQVAMRFIDADGSPASRYPANPNGTVDGVTGLCNDDGRVTILMPHPERTVAGTAGSWWPDRQMARTPWMQLFHNARRWVS
jgi:phosphoribosylformylglycinamidine synthase